MSKKSLMDRIPWFRSADAEPDVEADQEEETPTEEAAQQEEATGTEETITVAQLVEQVKVDVLEELKAQVEPIIEIIQELDGAIRTQDEAIALLVQNDVAKVKSLLEGGDLFKDLYVRSRDEEAAKPALDVQPQGKERQVRELGADETPSGVIFGQSRA